ncbi:zinc finger CCCH-type with G patch domain-containing protein isoform X2 [Balaenoptera musculus]|uniref:Zinc finger CCCH-type with G patch domain-containing protein n=1 Tax=Balaenoptera musculus TaxID=9771 RepID=A0A8B8V5M0_BALMU|nr:zinc finger CCCH-type with G patch domain-containing protein isoform X2 [Balaenoptera musculus]
MDEESLQTALRTYDAQLQQVELALGAGLDPSELADLRQLQGDLKELIELTEASLVSVRKSKLLAALDGERPAQEDAEYLAFQNAIAEAVEVPVAPEAELETVPMRETGPGPTEPGREEDEREDEDGAELSGRKVNAPYYSAWGTLEYHNAMIVGTEEADDGSPGVRVLYLYPTHKSLKPCPFFLEGKCRFQESCRFSHGQVVSVDELRPFQDPDLSSLQAGSACLAKRQDGLWYPARITDVDSGYYTVKFDSLLLKEAVVEGDSILPPLRTEPAGSSDSDGSDVDEPSYARVVEPGAADPGTCSSAFAGWEVHTRGIGSRLLAKMGYEFGKDGGEDRADPASHPGHPGGPCPQCWPAQRDSGPAAGEAGGSPAAAGAAPGPGGGPAEGTEEGGHPQEDDRVLGPHTWHGQSSGTPVPAALRKTSCRSTARMPPEEGPALTVGLLAGLRRVVTAERRQAAGVPVRSLLDTSLTIEPTYQCPGLSPEQGH